MPKALMSTASVGMSFSTSVRMIALTCGTITSHGNRAVERGPNFPTIVLRLHMHAQTDVSYSVSREFMGLSLALGYDKC